MTIALTESAAAKATEMMDRRPNPPEGLRVGVRGGGCAGLQYFLEFCDEVRDGDRSLTSHGINLYVDPKSFLYLMGTEVDYVDGLLGAGFKFNNPNVKRTCGCGESFGY